MEELKKLIQKRGKVTDSELLDMIQAEIDRHVDYNTLYDRIRHLHGTPDRSTIPRNRMSMEAMRSILVKGGMNPAKFAKIKSRTELWHFLLMNYSSLKLNPGGLIRWNSPSGKAIKGKRKPSPSKLAEIATGIGMDSTIGGQWFRMGKKFEENLPIYVLNSGKKWSGIAIFEVNPYQWRCKYTDQNGTEIIKIFNLSQIQIQ